MKPQIVYGDIINQNVDVIINSWNRNIIPWWLLLPQGVSGTIKKQGGTKPFQEVAKYGAMPLGKAVITTAGKLKFRAIIHVAGINMFWCATKYSVQQSVINAMEIVNKENFKSAAFPVIGSGSGNRGKKWSLQLMLSAFEKIESRANVIIVQYNKQAIRFL